MDLYEILGVPKQSDFEQIKRAYRKIAKLTHPDKTGGNKQAEDRFAEATNAYAILSDPIKRAAYDKETIALINSIGDLFRSSTGKHFIDYIQPTASQAPRNGNDTLCIVKVSPEILKSGGTQELPSPFDKNSKLLLFLEPGYSWYFIKELGQRGKRGGKNGDAYFYFVSNK